MDVYVHVVHHCAKIHSSDSMLALTYVQRLPLSQLTVPCGMGLFLMGRVSVLR